MQHILLNAGYAFDLAYWLSGCFCGFVVGLTGVGGGALMTPILLLVFSVPPVDAVATDLWYATITKLFGVLVHNRSGRIDWEVVKFLSYGSVPTSIVIIILMQMYVFPHVDSSLLKFYIGLMVVVVAFAMIIPQRKVMHIIAHGMRNFHWFYRLQKISTVVAGSLIGALVSLTSIGAGALGSIFLLLIYPRRMGPKALVGTDLAHALPLTIVCGAAYLILGYVDWVLLSNLLLGSVPGVIVGSVLCGKFKDSSVKALISILLIFTGMHLLA